MLFRSLEDTPALQKQVCRRLLYQSQCTRLQHSAFLHPLAVNQMERKYMQMHMHMHGSTLDT